MFYLIVIAAANICISFAVGLCIKDYPACFLHTAIATMEVIALDGLFAFLIRRLPEKWFSPESVLNRVSRKEQSFWRKLRVARWEKAVPELGCFTGFHKNRLEKSDDESYLYRFLLETAYGSVIHLENALFGILILLLPFNGGWRICVPVAIVNAFLSLLAFAVLRKNTAPLLFLYRRANRSAQTEAECSAQTEQSCTQKTESRR